MSYYEEVEIEDLDYDEKKQVYTYPCPCGDKFSIGLDELIDGEDVAICPSCTLRIKIIFDEDKLPELREESESEGSDDEQKGEKSKTSAEAKSGPKELEESVGALSI